MIKWRVFLLAGMLGLWLYIAQGTCNATAGMQSTEASQVPPVEEFAGGSEDASGGAMPPLIRVPLVGPMPRNAFWMLMGMSLLGLIGFGYVSWELLQDARRAARAVGRHYNPYISGQPVREVDMFFGRHDLLQRIVATLHSNSIMLHGERRIGKTTLLHQIAQRLETLDDAHFWFVPVYIDLEGTVQEVFFHTLMEEIVHKLSTLPIPEGGGEPLPESLAFATVPAAEYSDRLFNRDLHRILRDLQAYAATHHPGQQPRLILLMDEMDVVSQYDHLIQQQLRRIFMRNFAAALGAVVAGIQISRSWDRIEGPWYNLFNEVEVEPFDRNHAEELLVSPVQNVYTYDPAALDQIIEYSEGRPFRLQQYGLEAVAHMLAQKRRRITLADVAHAHRNIQQHGETTTHYA